MFAAESRFSLPISTSNAVRWGSSERGGGDAGTGVQPLGMLPGLGDGFDIVLPYTYVGKKQSPTSSRGWEKCSNWYICPTILEISSPIDTWKLCSRSPKQEIYQPCKTAVSTGSPGVNLMGMVMFNIHVDLETAPRVPKLVLNQQLWYNQQICRGEYD